MALPGDMKGYNIGSVAKMLMCGANTLRVYERLGYLKPKRTKGGIRSYSEADIARIKTIQRLTKKEGVNHPGVEVVLILLDEIVRLRRRVSRMRKLLEQAPLFGPEVQDG